MKKFKFTIKGHQYEVEIMSFENNLAELEVNGTHYSVEVEALREVKSPKTVKLVRSPVPQPTPEQSAIPAASAQATPVKAPLPGTILKVLATPGAAVKKGDTLLIMEAMKMENSITSSRDGRVAAIKVKEGDTVLQNDVLLELE
jgi:biotin carboxyl carrier protein